ncbi:hypothetical protein Lalb_Chr07g0178411 [Lupinus albus]|uniref:Uncharacterized protein n=1 Tax=Lupinus albus TaxID=3870 RepID=A0A6A4Q740_LUPAL|nr:hypothetical protein Lalb_Chr07g0178411 [Lupinus albus]
MGLGLEEWWLMMIQVSGSLGAILIKDGFIISSTSFSSYFIFGSSSKSKILSMNKELVGAYLSSRPKRYGLKIYGTSFIHPNPSYAQVGSLS